MRLTPHHDDGQENARPQLLEQNVGQGLEASVRNEEDRQTGIVLPVRHVQIFLESIELCVTDIRAIQE